MKMGNRELLIYECISFIPAIYGILYLIPFFRNLLNNTTGVLHDVFICISIFILLLSLWLTVKGFIFFIRKKDKNYFDYIWLLMLSNVFTFPVYWYFYVMKKETVK